MPLYEYLCKDCMKVFEAIVKLEEEDKPVKCPFCDKPLDKLMSAPMFRIH
jgi:putative FmdB family regulatory protein